MLLTKRAIVVLLKATVVTWDRVRELAYQILISLKLPWVGFENVSDMIPIVEMALTLCGSPRRREYEAGAQILHMMYDRHVRVMGWSLLENHMTKYTSLKNRTTMNQKSNTSFIFFHRLCDILITRLQYQSKHILRKTTNNYKGDDASSLSSTTNSSFHGVHGLHGHGLLLMYRRSLNTIIKKDVIKTSINDFQKLFSKLLHHVKIALNIALTVVAEDTTNDDDEESKEGNKEGNKGENERTNRDTFGDSKNEYRAKGVITTGGNTAAPPKVDCRGHFLFDDEDKNDDQDIVVSSWLLVARPKIARSISDTILRGSVLGSPESLDLSA